MSIVLLQTRPDYIKEATAPTAAEFAQFLKEANEITQQKLGHSGSQQLQWVWDGAGNHHLLDSEWALAGLQKEQHIVIPPTSPEFNKPVEHFHAQLQSKFQQRLGAAANKPMTMPGYMEMLKQEVAKVEASSIMEDVHSLPATFQAIIDTHGAIPPHKYR
jgi:hypothetical protein